MFISELEFLDISDYYYPPYDVFKWGSNKPIGLYPQVYDELQENIIIYLHLDYLKEFIELILPKINIKFKLITGFSDYSVPYLCIPDKNNNSDILLNSDKLLVWYGTNVYNNHDKIVKIPIGIPRNAPHIVNVLHDPDYTYIGWYSVNVNASIIQSTLLSLSNHLNRKENFMFKKDTEKLLYISYSIVTSNDSNIKEYDCFRYKLNTFIKDKTDFKINNIVDWYTNYNLIKEHKFVLCPFGRGIDSYRVWETIILGSIPIVFSSSLNDLYTDLPVLIINNFEDLNKDFLIQQYDLIIKKDYNYDKLKIEYWKNIISK